MTLAVVALGSNLGDRIQYLQFGVDHLQALSEIKLLKVSSIYETAAVGGPVDQPDYLNAVALIETVLSPEQLLAKLHEIEDVAHRVREVHHGPRTLDLDLIDYHGFTGDEPSLMVPHPRACERAFVLVPLHEISPDWQLGNNSNLSALLESVENQEIKQSTEFSLSVGAT